MHHAPAGPPLSVRLSAALARGRARLLAVLAVVRPGLRFVRRTRLVPVLLGALVIAAFALASPVPAGGRAPAGTAALTAPSDGGRGLVPATADGWTEDGAPASAPDSGGAPEDVPASAPVGDTASEAPLSEDAAPSSGAGAPEPPVTAARTSPEAPSGTPSAGTSRAPAPSSSTVPSSSVPSSSVPSSSVPSSSVPSSSVPSSSVPSAPAGPSSSSAAPSSSAEVEAPAGDQVLAAVNAARTASGCEPLTLDAGLAGTAAAHSAAMGDQATLLPPPGAGAVTGGVSDPSTVAAGWLADPAVPATDCALTSAGIGVAGGWWTLLLA